MLSFKNIVVNFWPSELMCLFLVQTVNKKLQIPFSQLNFSKLCIKWLSNEVTIWVEILSNWFFFIIMYLPYKCSLKIEATRSISIFCFFLQGVREWTVTKSSIEIYNEISMEELSYGTRLVCYDHKGERILSNDNNHLVILNNCKF